MKVEFESVLFLAAILGLAIVSVPKGAEKTAGETMARQDSPAISADLDTPEGAR